MLIPVKLPSIFPVSVIQNTGQALRSVIKKNGYFKNVVRSSNTHHLTVILKSPNDIEKKEKVILLN